jgi:hypothetical protein
MKTLILSIILAFTAAAEVLAQGTVDLENNDGNGAVTLFSANGPLAQPGTYKVALLWWDGSSFVQEGAVYQSSAANGDGPGYFTGETINVPTYSAEGTFIVQAWTGNFASYAAAYAAGSNVLTGQTAAFTNAEGDTATLSPPVPLSGATNSGWDGNIILVPKSAGPVTITTQPASTLVNAYDTASFSVSASSVGTYPISYQWSFNGANIAGATSSVLTISNVTQANLGNYSVSAGNPYFPTESSNAVLSMYPFLAAPFPGAIVFTGGTSTISVGVWGSGPLSYQWWFNGNPVDNATDQTLTLTNIQSTNAGLYSVVVANPFGSVTNTPEQLVVNPANVSIGLSPTLIVSGIAGGNYIIQRVADLGNTNSWVTVTNLTLSAPVQNWTDTSLDASLSENPRQFYRILPGQ